MWNPNESKDSGLQRGLQRDDWGNPVHRRVLLRDLEAEGAEESVAEGDDRFEDESLAHPIDDGDLL